jgi:hypothetical protein
MVEQISVLSSDNAMKLQPNSGTLYPKETSLPALYKDQNGVDNISEREILYKILFDLRKDMNDLKKIVLESATNPAQAAQLVKEHAGLFEGLNETISAEPNPLTYLNACKPTPNRRRSSGHYT